MDLPVPVIYNRNKALKNRLQVRGSFNHECIFGCCDQLTADSGNRLEGGPWLEGALGYYGPADWPPARQNAAPKECDLRALGIRIYCRRERHVSVRGGSA